MTYDITINGRYESSVTIAFNWTILGYNSGPDGPPPLPPLHPDVEDYLIIRDVIFNEGGISGTKNITGSLIIPDYNPEWLSIDIRVGGVTIPYSISGTLTHECIPAPGAIILGCIGIGCVNRLRKRRKI
jgi:hypothetical protein